MCCSTGDQADVFDWTFPKAREQWRCGECSVAIVPGQRYTRIAVLYDGRWSTYRNCLACWGAKERAAKFRVALYGYAHDELVECVPHGWPCDETEPAYAEFGASVGLLFALNEQRAAIARQAQA